MNTSNFNDVLVFFGYLHIFVADIPSFFCVAKNDCVWVNGKYG